MEQIYVRQAVLCTLLFLSGRDPGQYLRAVGNPKLAGQTRNRPLREAADAEKAREWDTVRVYGFWNEDYGKKYRIRGHTAPTALRRMVDIGKVVDVTNVTLRDL